MGASLAAFSTSPLLAGEMLRHRAGPCNSCPRIGAFSFPSARNHTSAESSRGGGARGEADFGRLRVHGDSDVGRHGLMAGHRRACMGLQQPKLLTSGRREAKLPPREAPASHPQPARGSTACCETCRGTRRREGTSLRVQFGGEPGTGGRGREGKTNSLSSRNSAASQEYEARPWGT